MTSDEIDELPLRRYLLGDTSPEERRSVEERLLDDGDFFDRLSLVEDELIDEYVRGMLSDDEREKFVSFFMSLPERRAKLEILQSLKSYVAGVKAAEPVGRGVPRWAALTTPMWLRGPAGFSLAAVLLLTLLGVTWLIYRSRQTQEQPLQVRVPEEVQRSPEPPVAQSPPSTSPSVDSNVASPHPADSPRNRNAPTPSPTRPGDNVRSRSPVYAITLSAPLVRDAQAGSSFTIPRAAKLVSMTAEFESEDYEKYRAVVRNVNTGEQVTRDGLAAAVIGRGKRVVFSLPAKNLPPGDYILSLSGVIRGGETEDVRSYYFRIKSP